MENKLQERMPFAFGVNQFTTLPWSFEQDLERYSALAVDCIELCEIKLDGLIFEEQLAVLATHPLKISAVQPLVRTLFPAK